LQVIEKGGGNQHQNPQAGHQSPRWRRPGETRTGGLANPGLKSTLFLTGIQILKPNMTVPATKSRYKAINPTPAQRGVLPCQTTATNRSQDKATAGKT